MSEPASGRRSPMEPTGDRPPSNRRLKELLRASSRTFYVGIVRLPRGLRRPVTIAYLLLRVSDYLEDNELMTGDRKAELLLLWDRVLAGEASAAALTAHLELPDPPSPDAAVAAQAPAVLAALDALPARFADPIRRHVRDSTVGMARWARRGPRVRTESDLDDYMHEVAGRVGFLLTDLFTEYSPLIRRRDTTLWSTAREFGLALQTVNVIRGLRDDYERGWIFVPDSAVAGLPVSREDLFRPENLEHALAVVDWLARKADRHLDAAARYIQALPAVHHAIRLFCLFPFLIAVRTLSLSRGNPAVMGEGVKVSRAEVGSIVRRATLIGWSNRWIRRIAAELAVPPSR